MPCLPVAAPPVVDAKVWLNTWFGRKNLDSGFDTDGIQIGFASDYAMHDRNEDFAETFRYYVYYPEDLFDRVFRQSANGSNTLSMKAALIAELYTGMSFTYWGVPAELAGLSTLAVDAARSARGRVNRRNHGAEMAAMRRKPRLRLVPASARLSSP